MPELKDLREKRGRLIKDANTILEAVAADKRESMTPEEEQRFDKLHGEADSIKGLIERTERSQDEMRALEQPLPRKTDPNPIHRDSSVITAEEHRDNILRAWLTYPTNHEIPERWSESLTQYRFNPAVNQINVRLARQPLKSYRDLADWEKRAQGVGVGSTGGFTVPDSTMAALEIALLEFGGVRQAANVIRTSTGSDLPIPQVDDTAVKGTIISEHAATSEQAIVFSTTILNSFKYSSREVLVSNEMLQDSSIDVAAFVGRALGERIGRIQNDHFTTGTGTGQPFGFVAAATVAKTGASATSVTYAELLDLIHSVDPAYRAQGASFMMHDLTLLAIKKLVDGNQRPLWVAGMTEREPDRLLGYGFSVNQSMAAIGSSAKSIAFGAFRHYWVRDVQDFALVRLVEKYAENAQIAFLGWARADADLIGTAAIKIFQNAA